MMKRYETSEFRADASGIALLRSKYAYKTISFQEIDELQIRKGSVVKNPILVFIMGLLLIFGGLYIGDMFSPLNVTNNQLGVKGGKALGYLIFLIIGLLCFGGILIYQSLKKDFILYITAKSFNESYPLTELRKNNELYNMILDLKKEAGSKLKVATRELGI